MKLPAFLSTFLTPLQKDSNVTRAIIINAHGDPKHSPRNFTTFAKEGYQWCVTVYSCINLVANSCAGIKIKLVNSRGRILDKHPKIELLRKPNPEQHYAEYMTSLVSFDLISGNVFENAIGVPSKFEDPGSILKKAPSMLEVLRPDRIKILPGVNGNKVGGYSYEIGNQKIKFDPSRIFHRKRFHPTDDWWGLSPLEAGGVTVDTDNASSRWNLFLLQNYGAPAGLIVVKGNLTEEQRANLVKDVQLKYSGPENAGRPMLVESDGGADWKPISTSPKDMDWMGGRKITARDICKIFGVPSQLLGDPDSQTYANFEMAEEAFFKNTICPYMDKIIDGWNSWFATWWDDGTKFFYDKNDIEALQEDEDGRFDRYRADYVAGILSKNEYLIATGRDPVDETNDPMADIRLVPNTFVPVTQLTVEAPEPEPTDDDLEPEEGEKFKSFGVNTPEKKKAYFKSVDRQRRSHTFKAVGVFGKQLKADIKECAKIVRNSDNVNHAKNEVDKYLNHDNKDEWKKCLKSVYKSVIPDFGKRVLSSLGKSHKDDAYDWDDSVQEYLKTYGGKKITGINDTTRTKIMASIEEAVENGMGISDMADNIEGIDSDYRAEMIGRTEVIGASNYGSLEGAYATGLDCNKVWLSEIDDRTRGAGKNDEFDHISVDGESVGLDDEFQGTGEPMDFPGDPDGDGGDVINCRCTLSYEVNE